MKVQITDKYIKSTTNVIRAANVIDDTFAYIHQLDIDIPYANNNPIFIPIDTTLTVEALALYKYVDGEYVQQNNTLFIIKGDDGVILGVVASIVESGKYAVVFNKQVSATAAQLYNLRSLYFGITPTSSIPETAYTSLDDSCASEMSISTLKSDRYFDYSCPSVHRISTMAEFGSIVGLDFVEKLRSFEIMRGNILENTLVSPTKLIRQQTRPTENKIADNTQLLQTLNSERISESSFTLYPRKFILPGTQNYGIDLSPNSNLNRLTKDTLDYSYTNPVHTTKIRKWDSEWSNTAIASRYEYTSAGYQTMFTPNAILTRLKRAGYALMLNLNAILPNSLMNVTTHSLNENKSLTRLGIPSYVTNNSEHVTLSNINFTDMNSNEDRSVVYNAILSSALQAERNAYIPNRISLLDFKADECSISSLELECKFKPTIAENHVKGKDGFIAIDIVDMNAIKWAKTLNLLLKVENPTNADRLTDIMLKSYGILTAAKNSALQTIYLVKQQILSDTQLSGSYMFATYPHPKLYENKNTITATTSPSNSRGVSINVQVIEIAASGCAKN